MRMSTQGGGSCKVTFQRLVEGTPICHAHEVGMAMSGGNGHVR